MNRYEREEAQDASALEREHVVDVTAIPGTLRVLAADLQRGDEVFDIWGQGYALTRVSFNRNRVYTIRSDNRINHWHRKDKVTVRRVTTP